MYRCQNCNTVVGPRQKLNKVITEKRLRKYIDRERNITSSGWEIVKELKVCTDCETLLL